jgi:DNA repair photolyase
MTPKPPQRWVGRGASLNPPNRFESTRHEADDEQLAADDERLAPLKRTATQFLPDQSATILRENDSPDIPFRYSLNPYRGCEHGCAYCYARPTHETLGFSAGLDFESRILVKRDAAQLLRRELNHPRWQPQPIMMAGVTDCYQPAERHFRITRSLLEVLWEARQPVCIVTKNALILRDLDLLAPMAAAHLVSVAISVTTLDPELARTLEPRTSSPSARVSAIRTLADHGVPVRAMVAPLIPGLTDTELPAILEAARDAGARGASWVLLRLPLAVAPIFLDWLRVHRPQQASRVESRIRQTRQGNLYQSQFGARMRGTGAYAELLDQTFVVLQRKLGLDQPWPPLDCSQFRPPRLPGGQLSLF